MNFFRSILSEDPDPPVPENPQQSIPKSPTNPSQHHDDDDEEDVAPNPISSTDTDTSTVWSFGGLIKTLTTKSESVLDTYRRDLKEFGSGLQKETAAFREVASRAVKDLPASIEVGASAIDGVLKSTAEIISHGKETLLAPSDGESEESDSHSFGNQGLSSAKYSRFDAQLRAIQSDANTYCEEPEDLGDYEKWKLGFVLEERSEQVKNLIEVNGSMEGMYKRVVPNLVDHETFWCRYFYRVHKLKLQEDVRANLVRRAISVDYDEELSWDVDEDEDDNEKSIGLSKVETKELGSEELPQVGSSKVVDDKGENNKANVDKGNVTEESSEKKELGSEELPQVGSSKVNNKANVDEGNVREDSSEKVTNEEVNSKSDEKVGLDEKVESGESCKDSDVSVVSTQPSLQEEEDLGWDEIEDLGSSDEKKATQAGSPNRADLRKRLSAADEDEDLNWDIEDDDEDDEPVTKPGTK